MAVTLDATNIDRVELAHQRRVLRNLVKKARLADADMEALEGLENLLYAIHTGLIQADEADQDQRERRWMDWLQDQEDMP